MLTRHHSRTKAFILPSLAIITAFCCTTLPSNAAETYYRWVNKDGSTEYTKQRPPEGIPFTEISPLGVGKGKAPGKQQTASSDEAGSDAGEQETEQPKKDPKICKQAKSNLSTMEAHERIRLVDEKGEPYILTEDQRQEQIQRAKDAIKRNC